MDSEECLKRIEELIKVLDLKFRKSKKADYSEPRYSTTWGTKTKKGLIATISRIVYE